jgi:hypothetical protein
MHTQTGGKMNKKGRPARPAAERFWENIDKRSPDECWPWKLKPDTFGYGRMKIKGKMKGAHREAWELTNGEIPAGMWVLHSCDNPPCCNPAHLFLGTSLDNARDRAAKGRSAHNKTRAKLNESQVLEIRKLGRSGMSEYAIAKMYTNIGRSNVHAILARITWKNLGVQS